MKRASYYSLTAQKRGRIRWVLSGMVILFFIHALSFAETTLFSNGNVETEPPDPFEIRLFPPDGKAIPGHEVTARMVITIPSGYKLFADKVALSFSGNPELQLGKLRLPPSRQIDDPYIGKIEIFEGVVEIPVPMTVGPRLAPGAYFLELIVSYQGCSQTKCFMPKTRSLSLPLTIVSGPLPSPSEESSPVQVAPSSTGTIKPGAMGKGKNPFQNMADRFGIGGVILFAFIWGFMASLTPCVYPMIPVTISVIGAGGAGNVSRSFLLSSVYVLGLSLTYAVMGAVAAFTGGLFGEYAGSPALRVIIAVLFSLMALGMFDLFFIQMPSRLSSKLQAVSGKGVIGIFLVGAAAGLVVGPCVGPMLVSLLMYVATLGNLFLGFLMMWSFALGLGVLLLVIGTFSGLLTALPKAGMWMEKVKHLFGMIMFAMALYFIRPLIPETLYLSLAGLILLGTGVFIGGVNTIQGDATVTDKFLKTIGLFFLIWGALTIYQGTLPRDQVPRNLSASHSEGPLLWQQDEPAAIAAAKESKRPLVIDFYAEWCASCKKLEKTTFSDPLVIGELQRFDLLKIDATESDSPRVKTLLKKYGVIGLPTILFINAHGEREPDHTITDYATPRALMETLRKIR